MSRNKLRNFHKAHFPGQSIPPLREISTFLPDSSTPAWQEEDDQDQLGWYDDGARRTLTDEQIAMFRHSEIQRLLQQRRLNAELAGSHSDTQANREPGQITQGKTAKGKKLLLDGSALLSDDVKLDSGQEGQKPASSLSQVEGEGVITKSSSIRGGAALAGLCESRRRR